MNFMIEPCKARKCISYPVCITKRLIKCVDFSHWLEKITVDHRSDTKTVVLGIYLFFTYHSNEEEQHEIWNRIRTVLPNLKGIDYYGYLFYATTEDRRYIEDENPLYKSY